MHPDRHSRKFARHPSAPARAALRKVPRTYFHTQCAACGRKLYVRVEHLGKQVMCQHCGYHFRAADPSSLDGDATESESVLARVDRLLAQRKHRTDMEPFPDQADGQPVYFFLD